MCTKMLIGPNPLLEAVLVAWPGTLKKDTLVWKTKGSIEEVVKGSQAFQHILILGIKKGNIIMAILEKSLTKL